MNYPLPLGQNATVWSSNNVYFALSTAHPTILYLFTLIWVFVSLLTVKQDEWVFLCSFVTPIRSYTPYFAKFPSQNNSINESEDRLIYILQVHRHKSQTPVTCALWFVGSNDLYIFQFYTAPINNKIDAFWSVPWQKTK